MGVPLTASSSEAYDWDNMTLVAVADLDPAERAAFAVTSRLLSCIVTEALLPAVYVPTSAAGACGVCVILTALPSGEDSWRSRPLRREDIFAIVPVHGKPVLKGDASERGTQVWMLDPLDMLPSIYDAQEFSLGASGLEDLRDAITNTLSSPPWELGTSFSLNRVCDPLHWWHKFAQTIQIDSDLRANLAEELLSSYTWQIVPRQRLEVKGEFEGEMHRLVQVAAEQCKKPIPEVPAGSLIMPVYYLQRANIRAKFPDVDFFDDDFSLDALGQTSLRTVVIPGISDLAIKLAVGIKVSSALRTISHFTADVGPRFSTLIIPKLNVDRNILHIESETSSAVYVRDAANRDVAPDVAKHFTAVIRQQYPAGDDESVIICAALLDWGHEDAPKGIPVVIHLFELYTHEKRVAFFDEYARLLIDALLPAMLHNGLAFEAHPQNSLLRISRSTRALRGFVLRDLGGLRMHAPTLCASTGVDFTFLPEHCVVTDTLAEASKKLYHTLFHNHLQRLARLLGLHYNGVAGEILRKHLERNIPRDAWLWKIWMAEDARSVSGKCLMRMKIQGLYRDSVYEPFPNIIQYRPTEL
ncbi:hypothetical protein EWM64_g1072 [Hericium alpestre]|uniref:Aerobactin siderophore biosynthesis IucA/IucC N-terminal domain-containing protein n=1 Tax=Hericium alpestre TaxID=135208 RepID=A0A4Z0A9G6_9AGAM|nr:hypothetical protein EWM64_g1072 [Hericium alpestre]